MTDETNTTSKDNGKSKEKSKKRDKMKPLTRVVIRQLPPTMTEEIFLKQTEPLPEHDMFYFVTADWSLGQDATCRAYINFVKQEDIFSFKDRFDDYVFVESTGAEYPAIVEFAPFQGFSKNKSKKKDPKCNTLESDPQYINFLESLKAIENDGPKAELKMEFSYQIKNEKKITSTPLLQYLANKKQELRDEKKRKTEDKRRQRDEARQKMKNIISKSVPETIKESPSENEDNKTEIPKAKEKRVERVFEIRKDLRARRKTEREQRRKQEREKRFAQLDIKKDNKIKSSTFSQTHNNTSSKSLPENIRNEENETEIKSSTRIDEKEQINENVRKFIQDIASIQSLTSKANEDNIQLPSKSEEKESNDVKENNLIEDKQKLGKCQEMKPHNDYIKNDGMDNKHCEVSTRDVNKQYKNTEDKFSKKIRNKDRPSIEIYQPGKTRLNPKKDETRSSAKYYEKKKPSADFKSSLDKEEANSKKKVSRYSERRMSRAKELEVEENKNRSGSKTNAGPCDD